jgi:hypothetical protein
LVSLVGFHKDYPPDTDDGVSPSPVRSNFPISMRRAGHAAIDSRDRLSLSSQSMAAL